MTKFMRKLKKRKLQKAIIVVAVILALLVLGYLTTTNNLSEVFREGFNDSNQSENDQTTSNVSGNIVYSTQGDNLVPYECQYCYSQIYM